MISNAFSIKLLCNKLNYEKHFRNKFELKRKSCLYKEVENSERRTLICNLPNHIIFHMKKQKFTTNKRKSPWVTCSGHL